jgi:hypothetical protein
MSKISPFSLSHFSRLLLYFLAQLHFPLANISFSLTLTALMTKKKAKNPKPAAPVDIKYLKD